MTHAIGNIEVGVTLAPLSDDQTKRALAVSVAKDALSAGFGKPELDDLLDLTDYILNGDDDPCPFSLGKPASVDFDLGPVSNDALALYFGVKPAEPDVYTVGDLDGINSLPVGSVVTCNNIGPYYKLGDDEWAHVNWLKSQGKPSTIPAHRLVGYSSATIVNFIPGGV